MDVDSPTEQWEDIGGDDAGLYMPPPGEEGTIHSHAGGEFAFQQVFDSIHSQCVSFYFTFIFLKHFYRKRGDPRTRKDRIQQRINAWRQQLPLLVNAYLAWNCATSSSIQLPPNGLTPDLDTSPPLQSSSWKIKVLDFYGELHGIHYYPLAHI